MTHNDCWNTIGIRGDRSCAELTAYGHCHYCHVFIESAHAALRKTPSPDILAEWTESIRQPRQEKITQRPHSIIIFRLGNQLFTLPSHMIDEVTSPKPVHKIPHCQSKVFRGLINIHGILQPCVSIGFLLNIAKTTYKSGFQRLVVMTHNNNKLAFFTNECRSTWQYQNSDLKQPPNTLSATASTYIIGTLTWQQSTLTCLDGETVFSMLEEQLIE